MCELMTIAAALVFTVLAAKARKGGSTSGALGSTALFFWGAALMWSVDCAHSLMEGEGLLDLSLDDTLLGAVIVLAGVAIYAAMAVRERKRAPQG